LLIQTGSENLQGVEQFGRVIEEITRLDSR
jgi:hypothetical protein